MKRLIALFLLAFFPLFAFGAADDIARLYTFSSGQVIQSSQMNGEFNQLVGTMNNKAGRGVDNTFTGANTFSGNNTFSGVNTFSHASQPIKTDFLLEYTPAAGITADSVLLKDGGVTATGASSFSNTATFTGPVLFPDDGELTIASGAVTVTGVFHTLDTQSDASSDDLDTINGGADGKVLILQSEADARNVVVKHNTGNIYLANGSDYTLDTKEQTLTLYFSSALSKWVEIARSAPVASADSNDFVLITSGSVSGGAALDLTDVMSSTYDDYVFVIHGTVATDDAAIVFQVSEGTGGSPSFIAGTNYNGLITYGGATAANRLADSKGYVTSDASTAGVDSAGSGFSAECTVYNANSSTNKRIRCVSTYVSNVNAAGYPNISTTTVTSTAALKAFKWTTDGGNLTATSYAYARAKS